MSHWPSRCTIRPLYHYFIASKWCNPHAWLGAKNQQHTMLLLQCINTTAHSTNITLRRFTMYRMTLYHYHTIQLQHCTRATLNHYQSVPIPHFISVTVPLLHCTSVKLYHYHSVPIPYLSVSMHHCSAVKFPYTSSSFPPLLEYDTTPLYQ